MNLTQIKAAKDGDELVDDDVRGLQLRVHGARKSFLLYYRTKAGQRRRPKLGDFPSMTLAQARDAARALLAQVALGADPSANWQAARAQETMGELCDRYLSDYAEEHKRTAWRDKQRINKVIAPRWGTRPAADITKEDVMGLRRAMKDIPVTFIRHSFASEALSAGYTLDQIAELFGHASVQTTRRYAHLIQDKKRQAATDIAAQMERRLAARAV